MIFFSRWLKQIQDCWIGKYSESEVILSTHCKTYMLSGQVQKSSGKLVTMSFQRVFFENGLINPFFEQQMVQVFLVPEKSAKPQRDHFLSPYQTP